MRRLQLAITAIGASHCATPLRARGARMVFLLTLALLAAGFAAPAASTELTIGLIPEQNVFRQMNRYKPIAEYIEGVAGIEIKFTILPRYGNIIERYTAEHLDGAFWGSFTGALAIRKLGVEPIVRPLWEDGSSSYHGHVFVRKDSNIKNVSDMRGKSIAFVDRATTAGYVFPMAYLKEHGVNEVAGYFKEHYFAGSHDATITAVLDGKVAIGCAKNTIYGLVAERNPRVLNELVILAESPAVPSNALGLRSDLEPAVRSALATALLGMNESNAGQAALRRFGAIRFIETGTKDYAPVFRIAERAGIDLKTYQYVND